MPSLGFFTLANLGPQSNYDGDVVAVTVATTGSGPAAGNDGGGPGGGGLGDLVSLTASGLPPGLSLSGGQVVGTIPNNADQGGPYVPTLTALDLVTGISISKVFNWGVSQPTVTPTNPIRGVAQYGSVTIDPSDLGTDSAGDALTITSIASPSYGTLTANSDGRTYTYNSTAVFPVSESLAYTVSDAFGGTATGTLTVAVQPVVYFSSVDYGDGQGDSAVVTIRLSAASAQAVTVQYATNDGTAVAGTDYIAAAGPLTIPAGQTSATFSVTILTNAGAADGEQFTITLSNPTNASLAAAPPAGLAAPPAATEFTIFVPSTPAPDDEADLNTLSGKNDPLLSQNDGIVVLIPQCTNFSTLEGLVFQVCAAANDVTTNCTQAAGLCEGELFRAAGIERDLDRLTAQLDVVWNTLHAEAQIWNPASDQWKELFWLAGEIGNCYPSTTEIVEAAENTAIPVGNTVIPALNNTYEAMQALVDGIIVNDTIAQATSVAMTVASVALPYFELPYDSLVLFLGTVLNANMADAAGPLLDANRVDQSGLALAQRTADGDASDDDFAIKGVQSFLAEYNAYLGDEISLVNYQVGLVNAQLGNNSPVAGTLSFMALMLDETYFYIKNQSATL